MNDILHYPSLKTVLMVEDVLKKSNLAISREKLKIKLKKKVMHQTLNVILKYLEDSGKIIDGRKGIVWIYNPSSKINKAINNGLKL
jgi:hypothetical protein